MRTAIITLVTLCLALVAMPLRSDEASPATVPKEISDFCHRAIEHDRGVVHTPFAGSTDSWVAMLMLVNKDLRSRMKISSGQMKEILPLATVSAMTLHHPEILQDMRPADDNSTKASRDADAVRFLNFETLSRGETGKINLKIQARLDETLNREQQNQLDLVYLNLEGLMALQRSHLAIRLSITSAQQVEMAHAIKENLDEAIDLHRAEFTINKESPKDAEAVIHKDLREVSVHIDQKITGCLKQNQLKELAEILKAADNWENISVGPGLQDRSVKEVEQAGHSN